MSAASFVYFLRIKTASLFFMLAVISLSISLTFSQPIQVQHRLQPHYDRLNNKLYYSKIDNDNNNNDNENNNNRDHNDNSGSNNLNPCGYCKNGYFCLSIEESSSCIPTANDGIFDGTIVNNLKNTIKAVVFSLSTDDSRPIELTNVYNATFVEESNQLVIPDYDVIYYGENFIYGYDLKPTINLNLNLRSRKLLTIS
ncbi:hypothetical protein PPL_00301 [Heterostelium album PN500]|uniref:Uncharacterized protein n=1 Tax=Heterostelium pallidum (strain ATCC 26659 / Pp 5 / PN500) TaxID=670386 RepID=D3AW34_HETP5|nr:hypothetical protein PPL_00301 [Heterostelium album PN500]EFA86507.1 hypothetical protein PPL_00301 [Heterostelium album PN500]|eukprot:XP_020438612.1 hypothetical protein PPL_00301 [Heterostelium album PN500]